MVARSCGNLHVLSEDNIWDTANDIWKELPNNKIVSGCVQAYQIAKKKENGGNTFLGTGGSGIHMGVRNDFFATDKGLIRKDGKVISDPVRTREE